MAFQNNEIQTPSKGFLVKACLAIALIAGFFFFQKTRGTIPFFAAKKTELKQAAATAKDSSRIKDSNNNGISDWEERLWGLDPTVESTGGIPNKAIIEEKKKQLAGENGETINKTDQLAQRIYVISSALGNQGQGDQSVAESALDTLSSSIKPSQYPVKFTKRDIRIVPTSIKSLTAYKQQMEKKTSSVNASENEITIIVQATEQGNTQNIALLGPIGKQYLALAKDISTIPVPVGVARYHLALLNDINGIGRSLIETKTIADDPVAAVSSITAYRNYSNAMLNNAQAIQAYLMRYTIQ